MEIVGACILAIVLVLELSWINVTLKGMLDEMKKGKSK